MIFMKEGQELDFLVETLLSIRERKEMKDFLLGILTEVEFKEISRRLQIVRMLKEGVSQHQIARELNVGVATVTRGSKELKKGRFKNVE
jgi:TrpR family transcriptional regulator, trp operon repressor